MSQEGLSDPKIGGNGQATVATPWEEQSQGNSGLVKPGPGGMSRPCQSPEGCSWQAVDPGNQLKCSVSLLVVSDSATLWTAAHQARLSMEFSRQDYWSGLPFPSPGDLPNLGVRPIFSASQMDLLPFEPAKGTDTHLLGLLVRIQMRPHGRWPGGLAVGTL